MVPCKCTAIEVSYDKILLTDVKVRTTLHVSIIDSGREFIHYYYWFWRVKSMTIICWAVFLSSVQLQHADNFFLRVNANSWVLQMSHVGPFAGLPMILLFNNWHLSTSLIWNKYPDGLLQEIWHSKQQWLQWTSEQFAHKVRGISVKHNNIEGK